MKEMEIEIQQLTALRRQLAQVTMATFFYKVI